MKRKLVQISKSLLPPGAWQSLKKMINKMLLWTHTDLLFYYNEDYAKGALKNNDWVDAFCREVSDIFSPGSIIDFGCGIGVAPSGFEKMGKEILGVDGSGVNKRHALIDKKKFIRFDLRRPFIPGQKFDLCMCLEVAEHIEERYSDVLLGNIARASHNVLFSAAPPEQCGDCHCNLKPNDWWIKKFNELGFVFDKYAAGELR